MIPVVKSCVFSSVTFTSLIPIHMQNHFPMPPERETVRRSHNSPPMTSSEVTVQTRLQRPFIGVSGTVTIPTIPAFYAHLETLSTWIARDGLSCSGPPFLNYHRINMQNTMDVTLGFFVENIDSAAGMGEQVDGGTKVAGVLPGGLFACMDYVGQYVFRIRNCGRMGVDWLLGSPRNLIRAHAEIQEWCVSCFLHWLSWCLHSEKQGIKPT